MISALIEKYERFATKIDKYMVPFEILAFVLFFIGLYYMDSDVFEERRLGFLFLIYAIFIACLGIFTYCFALKEQKLVNGVYVKASYYGNRLSKFMYALAIIHFTFGLLFFIFIFVFVLLMQENG